MSKAAVKISADLLNNPLCEQDQGFLESMTALDTAMKRMDAFNQEKVRLISTISIFHSLFSPTLFLSFFLALVVGIRTVSGVMFLFRHTKEEPGQDSV